MFTTTTDYIENGVGYGPIGQTLQRHNWDPGYMRPYFDERGNRCVTINSGKQKYDPKSKKFRPVLESVRIGDLMMNGITSPVFNATTLRKEEWLYLDQKVIRAARRRLRAWQDLMQRSSYGGFNGMAKMILEHETMSDPGEAFTDMDGLTMGRTDAPMYQLEGLPLPITHSGFFFSQRRLLISRNSGMPLDTTMGESCGRRVAEKVEKTLIGTNTGISYGGASTQAGGYGRASSVYGYTNFPPRLTFTSLKAPTTGGWTPADTLHDVLAMRDLLTANKFYGPFMLYTSDDWDQYMDNDYILTGGNVATQTLRERLRKIEGIEDVRRLDFLFSATQSSLKGPGGEEFTASGTSPFTLIMVQMMEETVQAVNGMDISTIQWETNGGMQVNFLVMCIWVPRLRADHFGNTGLCHGTTA